MITNTTTITTADIPEIADLVDLMLPGMGAKIKPILANTVFAVDDNLQVIKTFPASGKQIMIQIVTKK
jgi:2-phospho-L-lactate guanylyltransferase (CobY/MobA/RfbA family)